MKILLLEDDAILSDIIFEYLQSINHTVSLANDGKEALTLLDENKFDLAIFDINVPHLTGLDILKDIRFFKKTIPIIMITAYQDSSYLKKAFELGCDDYIKKPFDLEELNQRIKHVMDRLSLHQEIKISDDIFFMPDINTLTNKHNNTKTLLSLKESQILAYIVSNKNKVITLDDIYQNIWYDSNNIPSNTTLRVYITNLRKLLGFDRIKNIRGKGYIFE